MRAAGVDPHPCDGYQRRFYYNLSDLTRDPIAEIAHQSRMDYLWTYNLDYLLIYDGHARADPEPTVVVATMTRSRSLYGEPLPMD